MQATDVLSHEHRAIETVLDTMDKYIDHIQQDDEELDKSLAADCIEFLAGFLVESHYAKEEDILFPLLEERGMTLEGGPIGVMVHEHDESRRYIKQMREELGRWTAGETEARDDLADTMTCFKSLIRAHIRKEDTAVYTVASAVLTNEDDQRLVHEFEEKELVKIGPNVHENYHKMLDDIADRCKRL